MFRPVGVGGETHWNANTDTLTFANDGRLPNTHHGWNVPSKVEHIVITGTGGRGAAVVDNPNATVVVFREARDNAKITIDRADISVDLFRGSQWSMSSNPKVCRTVYQNGRGAPARIYCR